MDPTLEPTRRTALRDLHGRTIDGKYRVVRSIAQGGYGVVYEVRRVLLGEEQPERYALKTIRPDLRDRQDTVGRFRDEVLITHKLKTEFVCSVPDAGVLEGGDLYYMVMEFAEGGSLEEHLRDIWADNEEAPIERIERWFRQCVLAMCEAERAGVVHRDLKPQNILLSADLDIRVADFGIARHTDPNPQRQDLTGEHHWVGDRVWASPEQMMGDVTHRSDMYSLGATLHYALTRELPMRTRPCQPSLRRKDTPQWMDQAIVRMTQPVPEERFESFEDLLAVLPEPPPEPGSVWWRRVATGSVLLAIAAAVVLWFVWPDPVGDVTWAQYQGQRSTLAQQTAQLDTAAAGIAGIASLGQQVRDAVAKVGAVQQVAEREGRDQRAEDKVPQRLLDETDELSVRVAELAADIVAAKALAADLDKITADLPQRAIQASSTALQQRRENAKNAAIMDRYPELAARCEALGATITAARGTREDEVAAVRNQFAPGADLDALAAAAAALADTNDRRGETDFASTARQLARAAKRCIEVRDQLPALEFSGATAAAPLVGLRAFASWVEKAGEQRDLVGNETMAQGDRIRAWWKGTLERLVGDAAVLAQQEIGSVGGVMKPTVAALNAAVRAESLTPAQTLEYRRVEAQLVELAELGKGLPGWFTSATSTPEGRGIADARQAIERLVADLALVPIRRSYRVLITECERAIAALAEWRTADQERTAPRDYGTLRDELTAAEQAVRATRSDAIAFRDNDEVEDPKLDRSAVTALDGVLAQLARVDAGYASLASAKGQLANGNPTEALTTCGQAAAAAASCPTLQAEVATLVALCKKQIAEARANDAPRVQENPGIPEPEWAAWDPRLRFPAGLRGDVARGVWFFAARTLEGGAPVPMRLVTREVGGKVEGFLVDVHQVVRAEPGVAAPINKSKQIRDAILAGYYSKGLGGGSWQDAKDRCCFMGVTRASAQGAIQFWKTAYAGDPDAGEFSTLTRAQLEQLGGIEGHPTDDAAIDPIRNLDAPQEPVEGINTGLREFLIDVDYPSSTTFALYGLRATFNLKPF